MTKRIVLAICLAVGLAGISAPALAAETAPGAPASPPTWTATVEPSGTDQDAPTITTSGACPSPARDVIARIYGAGFPASGMNVIGNTSGGVSMESAFNAPLQQSLRDTRNQLPQYTPYSGTYTIVLSCIVPAYVNSPYGMYAVKIEFTDAQNWKALAPPSSAVGPIRLPNGQYVPGDSQQAKDYANGTGSFGPSASASASGAVGHPGNASGNTAATANPAHRSGTPWGALGLLSAGVLVAVITVIAFRPKKAATTS